jgi:flagellin
VDTSISGLVDQSAYLGAIQNRLESTLTSVMNVQEDVAGSESQIRDTDMAAEVTNLTKNQVISQSAMAMLSQSNQRPFQILDLLKNGR